MDNLLTKLCRCAIKKLKMYLYRILNFIRYYKINIITKF